MTDIVLMDHQKRNSDWLLAHDKGCDFSEQGTGKTYTALNVLVSREDISLGLIVCPKHLIVNWIEALHDYGFDTELDVVNFDLDKKKRNAEKEKILRGEYQVVVVNYDKVRIEEKFFMEVLKTFPTYVIVDEASKLGNVKTKITETFFRLEKLCIGIAFLNGTPINNSPVKVYPMFKICKPEIYPNLNSFYREHAVFKKIRIAGRGEFNKRRRRVIRVIDRWVNLNKLRDRMLLIGVRTERKDCLDLPDRVFSTRYIPMIPWQEKKYKQVLEELFILLSSGEVKATTNALSKMEMLRKICSNPYLVDEGFKYDKALLPKEEVLLEELELNCGPDDKAVIFCHYRGTFERLQQVLPEGSFVAVRGQERHLREKLDRFNTDPECRYFLGIIDACYTGLNLQVANVLINYELVDNILFYQQGIDRIYRRNQYKKVLVINFVVGGKKHIDFMTLERLKKKETTSDYLLEKFQILGNKDNGEQN